MLRNALVMFAKILTGKNHLLRLFYFSHNQTKPTILNPQITTLELLKFVIKPKKPLKCGIVRIPEIFISLSSTRRPKFQL